MKLLDYYPVTIALDDPDTGEMVDVRFRVHRMTLEECSAFLADYHRSANPPSAALVARQPDGPEQEKRSVEEGGQTREIFVIDDETIRRRRLAEMTEAERERFRAMEAEESTFADTFLARVVTEYVTAESGQLFDEVNGREVAITAGADLLRKFGARADVLRQFLRAVHYENTLSAPAKKALRSLSAFARSSAARPSGAAGPTPATTAADAGTAASVATEGAVIPPTTPSSSSSAAARMASPA